MAAVIAPHRSYIPPERRLPAARPSLELIAGGRRAARATAAARRRSGRLHPAVYRRRRLGVALVVVTVAVVAYLAVVGLHALTAAAAPVAPATAATASPEAATVEPTAVGSGGAPAIYVVRPGDTYWSIARTLKPSGEIRGLVDALEARSGAHTLVAGQSLRVDGLVD